MSKSLRQKSRNKKGIPLNTQFEANICALRAKFADIKKTAAGADAELFQWLQDVTGEAHHQIGDESAWEYARDNARKHGARNVPDECSLPAFVRASVYSAAAPESKEDQKVVSKHWLVVEQLIHEGVDATKIAATIAKRRIEPILRDRAKRRQEERKAGGQLTRKPRGTSAASLAGAPMVKSVGLAVAGGKEPLIIGEISAVDLKRVLATTKGEIIGSFIENLGVDDGGRPMFGAMHFEFDAAEDVPERDEPEVDAVTGPAAEALTKVAELIRTGNSKGYDWALLEIMTARLLKLLNAAQGDDFWLHVRVLRRIGELVRLRVIGIRNSLALAKGQQSHGSIAD